MWVDDKTFTTNPAFRPVARTFAFDTMEKSSLPKNDAEHMDDSFSTETIGSLQELGEVIRGIHNRLVAEGYVIKNGLILKRPEPNNKNDGGNNQ